jgi:hypothetical protein
MSTMSNMSKWRDVLSSGALPPRVMLTPLNSSIKSTKHWQDGAGVSSMCLTFVWQQDFKLAHQWRSADLIC